MFPGIPQVLGAPKTDVLSSMVAFFGVCVEPTPAAGRYHSTMGSHGRAPFDPKAAVQSRHLLLLSIRVITLLKRNSFDHCRHDLFAYDPESVRVLRRSHLLTRLLSGSPYSLGFWG
jgi:hypothetical protein